MKSKQNLKPTFRSDLDRIGHFCESEAEETETYRSERLDHLGIVAGGCQEIGLAGYLDAQDKLSRMADVNYNTIRAIRELQQRFQRGKLSITKIACRKASVDTRRSPPKG